MKKITLLVTAVLFAVSAAQASEKSSIATTNTLFRFNFEEPISFTERGIDFFIFPNGEFDFNTEPIADATIYNKSGRRHTNITFGAPTAYGVRIDHDALGRVRRIGNVFLNYDAQNRIKRVGSVYMSYNRFALSQVGGLKIIYNRRGEIVSFFGSVKGFQNGYDYGNTPTNYDADDNNTPNQSHYYFRKNDRKEKEEKEKEE